MFCVADDGKTPLLIDGRNRLDAMESLGRKLIDDRGELRLDPFKEQRGLANDADPYAYVLSANIHRRHLTPEQKRDLIAAVLKAQPDKSNRTIAKQTKTDHKTVGKQRDKLEATGEIPQLSKTTGADGKARAKPKKKRRDADDFRAEMDARKAAKAANAEPEIDRAELSMSAQEKLDAAIRQHKKQLSLEFDQRVHSEVNRRFDEIMLPFWKQRIEVAKTLYEHRKALMDKATFNTIRRALHPDSRNSISDKLLGEAFDAFMAPEKFVLNEKDSPTTFPDLPSSLAELDKMRKSSRRDRA